MRVRKTSLAAAAAAAAAGFLVLAASGPQRSAPAEDAALSSTAQTSP